MSVCVVNLAELDPASNGGLSRVARELSRVIFDFSVEQPTFYPVFAVRDSFAEQFAPWIERKSVVVIPINPQNPRRPILQGLNPDIIVSPLFGVEPFDQITEFANVRHIAVMPDTLALDLPQLFSQNIRSQRQQSYQRLKSAYHVITLTEYARQQLIHHLQLPVEAIHAIHLGADPLRDTTAPTSTVDVPQPYFFCPANTWLHKRHELAFQTFRLVLQQRPEVHLVLTGGRVAGFGVDLDQLMASNGIPKEHVHDLGYVSDAQLVSLYKNAEALLFTSRYEGFGMPIVEAMQLGCPVVCARLTAIPEVAGDAVLYVDSDAPQDWARAVLDDLPQQRQALIEKGIQRAAGFSWQETRRQYRELLLNAAPDVFGHAAAHNQPAVLLKSALKELDAGSFQDARFQTSEGQADIVSPAAQADLNVHLQYMSELLSQEKQFPLSRVPILGIIFRDMIRLRNLGRFWRSSSVVAREIMRRQTVLVGEIDEKLVD